MEINITYQLEEIESIEQLEDFDNEYVYDIEVDDDTHTFIANDILVHNSAYTTYGDFFKCFDKESQEKYNTPRKKIDWILKFNQEFLDAQNTKWCDEIYAPRHGKSIHKFELETISYSAIYLKKKKYLKGLAFSKGRFFDTPKMSGTGIELIKSTTPALCREILGDLSNSLMFEYEEDNKNEYLLYFFNKLNEWRRKFYAADIESISQSMNIGAYTKYVIDDTNQLLLEKGTPVSVKASSYYNYLAHKNGEDNKRMYSGKMKYYNTKYGNEDSYFGFPAGELPSWAPKMNKIMQWQKCVINPINMFMETMGLNKLGSGEGQSLSLF